MKRIAAKITLIVGISLTMAVASTSGAAAASLTPRVTADAIQCGGGKIEVYDPQIFATDTRYTVANGTTQRIDYWSIIQKWNGVSWVDQLSQYARGDTDTVGSTFIVGSGDTYLIHSPGYYRVQYKVNWWNGSVLSARYGGGTTGITSIVATGRFNPTSAAYRYTSPDMIQLSGDPGQAGIATGTPWCLFTTAA